MKAPPKPKSERSPNLLAAKPIIISLISEFPGATVIAILALPRKPINLN